MPFSPTANWNSVVVPGGKTQRSEREIRTALGADLARYKVPKRVLFVDELPRNKMGKIEKKSLRAQYQNLFATG